MSLSHGLRDQIVVVALAIGDVNDLDARESLVGSLEASKPACRFTGWVSDRFSTGALPLQVTF